MRVAAVIGTAVLASLAAVAPATATAKHAATGRLAGHTMLNAGCPGPIRPGGCNSWRPLPHAKFTVTRLNSAGTEVPGTTRTVESNSSAAFRVVLRAGSYIVKPMSDEKAKGGAPHRVRVAPRATTKTTVRYTAKIQPT